MLYMIWCLLGSKGVNRSPVVGTTRRCSSLAQTVTLMGDLIFLYRFGLHLIFVTFLIGYLRVSMLPSIFVL